jgi:hypothetical protein
VGILGVGLNGHRSGALIVATVITVALSVAGAGGALGATSSPVITVTPSTNLANGEQVSVSGAGLTPNVNGVLVECSSAAGQPTVEGRGLTFPVSCTNPFAPKFGPSPSVVTTSSTGTFDTTFVAETGIVGPPSAAGIDSAGNNPASDAANYPCPPTPAQQAAGDVCWISFTDGGGDAAEASLGFGSPITTTPTVSVQGAMAGGDTVAVTATGFTPNSPVIVEECNLTPGEPAQQFGGGPAIGCTQPVSVGPSGVLPSTDGSGSLTTDLTLQEGNVGGQAASVPYPCPPTPANVAEGGSCDVVVEDAGGHAAHAYVGLDGPVPVPSLSVSRSSGLLNGQELTVFGSGFSIDNSANLFECNDTPGEPTVDINGVQLPVGCSDPQRGSPFQFGFEVTGADGTIAAPFVVHTGVVGPPEQTVGDSSGIDSSGGEISTDTANYPCPPTPDQRAAGATCAITFTDNSNETVSTPISFGPAVTFHPSIALVALTGTIDVSNLPGGTELVVTGSGFTPDSPAIILECALAPGQPVDASNGLPSSCLVIQEVPSLITDESGEVTANAVIAASNVSPTPGVPPASVCPLRNPGPTTCAVVVLDAAGDQAQVPIGLSDSSSVSPGPSAGPPRARRPRHRWPRARRPWAWSGR